MVSVLPGQPVIDVAAGKRLTGKSHVSVQSALKQLEEAGILHRLNERKWGRVWECTELLELVEDFEETVSIPVARGSLPPAEGQPSIEILDELREERL